MVEAAVDLRLMRELRPDREAVGLGILAHLAHDVVLRRR
jgi:hypothetical protein